MYELTYAHTPHQLFGFGSCSCLKAIDMLSPLQAGHAVHEDQYQRLAEVIANFMQRFRIGQPKMAIPKAGVAGPPVLPIVAGPADKT
jgi:hypothetical protein